MELILKNLNLYQRGAFRKSDLAIRDGVVVGFSADACSAAAMTLSFAREYVFPGFTDVHVHLREPGFSYKETVASGTRAAAHGGYTSVCAMPNLKPVPDSLENLRMQLDLIERTAKVHVHPYGAITVGEQGEALAQLEEMAPYAAGFSDDGRGVQDGRLMAAAMERIHACGKILAAHCEDNSLLRGGYIHDGAYARAHGHKGICSESEWGPIARDLELAAATGCAYHVCHVSCKESVELIRQAKRSGVDVTCETAPHYLLLDESMLQEDGRFKMNPPLRDRSDREALLEGLLDGTVDMVATDHAPHSAEEKSKGLAGSLNGIVGLETAFPVLYTGLVEPGVVSLEMLLRLLHDRAAERFGIGTPLEIGAPADLTVFDLESTYTVDPTRFLSMGHSTPFAGREVRGACCMTLVGGKPVWMDAKRKEMWK